MNDVTHDSVRWGRSIIRYDYRFSQRKTLAISVHPDLRVEVVAPAGTNPEAIQEKVIKRAPWIAKRKREFELLLPPVSPSSYVNGESHYYLGRRYRLVAEAGDTNAIRLDRGRLRLTVRGQLSQARAGKVLGDWYHERAKALFVERLSELMEKARREAIPNPRMQLRTMSTRWGSCSRTGLITLNPLLVRAPRECIDYVIAHELCHLKEPHHGVRFWQLLERLMPDFQGRREKLEKFSQLVAP